MLGRSPSTTSPPGSATRRAKQPSVKAVRTRQARMSPDRACIGERSPDSRRQRREILATDRGRVRVRTLLQPTRAEVRGPRGLPGPDALDQPEVAVEVRGLGPLARPQCVTAMREVVVETVVVNDPPECQEHLGLGPITEAAAAEYPRFVQRPS